MANTVTRKRASPPTRRRRPADNGHRPHPARKPGSKTAGEGARAATALVKSSRRRSGLSWLARRAVAHAARRLEHAAVPAVAAEARDRLARLPDAAARLTDGAVNPLPHLLRPRLPIQCSLDVAVPLRVAWEEWMALEFLPEGVHTVRDIRRRRGRLTGHIGVHTSWHAEILDERRGQSFAWRSTRGSDCAGLITFHRLGPRLTRLELNLDVRPETGRDVLALSTHLAHRRADGDLRRFKARVELINPDVYEEG